MMMDSVVRNEERCWWTEMENHHVDEEILLRLPIKSLGRFRCVSKPCYTRLTSSEFSQKYFKVCQANNNNKLNFLLDGYGTYPFSSLSYYGNQLGDDNRHAKAVQLKQPLLLKDDYDEESADPKKNKKHIRYRIHGSCDGLFLVVGNTETTKDGVGDDLVIYIWNPTTGEYKLLPQLVDCDPPINPEKIVCGFGCDPTTDNNYKVLLLQKVDGDDVDLEPKLVFIAHLYTTHTNSWETLPNILLCHNSGRLPDSMTLAYANLHYLALVETDDEEPRPLIISFDLKDHKFRNLPWPRNGNGEGVSLRDLCAFNGNLCALAIETDCITNTYWKIENFGIEGEEHWTKFVCGINSQAAGKRLKLGSALHLFEDGQILLFGNTQFPIETYIVCYHTVNKTTRILYHERMMPSPISPKVYVESLISPNLVKLKNNPDN
ncbi:hypothetical protein AQUCO_02100183v1 [Aquilegia coerulea]|uniref:F-box associated domain-containing protein n=1 Tax=Aquilegia coerulea TaxID=218851 RepID=A0A2G5DF78_AQUCA|nr:hypothetical protein AQUCO_02100183v1 [Aquilegia coerulea]